MKYMLLSLLCILPLLSMDHRINPEIVRMSAELRNAQLYHGNDGFIVEEEGRKVPVYKYNMSTDLRRLSDQEVKSLLGNKNVLLYLKKLSDNGYSLELQGKLKGGTGPITAGIVWGIVSVGGYTAMLLGGLGIIAGSAAVAGPGAPTIAAPAIGMITAGGGTAAMIGGVQSAAVTASLWTLGVPLPLP